MWLKLAGGDPYPCNVPMPFYISELGVAGIPPPPLPHCAVLIAVAFRPIYMVMCSPHLMLYHVWSGRCGLGV